MARRLIEVLLGVALATATLAPVAAGGADDHEEREDLLDGVGDLSPYRADLHSHTAYSDGEETPAEAFEQAKATDWLDAFAVTDHSEWLAFPFRASFECLGPQAAGCYASPLPHRTEWGDTGYQAQRFTGEGFLAVRGFEWSSPVEGHVNVYNTRVWTDTVQTGPAPMTGLYAWLDGQRLDEDRFATFNHPGREPMTFDDFAYEPRADAYMKGLEAFNRDDDYSDTYLDALDEGWHVGAVGVTDAHGPDARVDRTLGHTVVLADALTVEGIARAYANHHTAATRGSDQDARLTVDGALMGDTLAQPGDTVHVELELLDAGEVGPTAFERVELLGPDGWTRDLATGPEQPCEPEGDADRARVTCEATVRVEELPATALGERYLTARAHQDYALDGSVEPTVVTSAVWLPGQAAGGGPAGVANG